MLARVSLCCSGCWLLCVTLAFSTDFGMFPGVTFWVLRGTRFTQASIELDGLLALLGLFWPVQQEMAVSAALAKFPLIVKHVIVGQRTQLVLLDFLIMIGVINWVVEILMIGKWWFDVMIKKFVWHLLMHRSFEFWRFTGFEPDKEYIVCNNTCKFKTKNAVNSIN